MNTEDLVVECLSSAATLRDMDGSPMDNPALASFADSLEGAARHMARQEGWLKNCHETSRNRLREVHRLRAIFGDHNHQPTTEQCEQMFNAMRTRILELETAAKKIHRIHPDADY